ncbi:uncharacterized protein LOC107775130 [Nicotiana tabacum]|uniref:Uncharacterized protein LOC107775130 n=1 Tax=Nicotiana tabacum TaxID=4097 RepID=A0A1S3YDK9_TOBAC|nr:PREDICTED: uncharacterized protein LOC107775130 [Nicotiana tabacum]
MDHSWRPHLPPPPIQGRICPTCSISHFPFCPPPPPPPFPSNPSFTQYPPYPPHQSLPRPPLPSQPAAYDPFVDHRAGPPMPPQLHPRPSDAYENSNPSFDYGNVGVKRMRIDDSTGSFMNQKLTNLARVSTDNERRLKLISEFGAANHELDTGHGSFDGGKYDGFLGAKNSNNRSYIDPGYGNLDRKRTFHEQEHFGQLGYDDNYLPGKNGYKYSSPQADSYHHNVEHDRQIKLYHGHQTPMDGHGYSQNHYSEAASAMQNTYMESKLHHYGSPYDQRVVNSVNGSGMSLYSAQQGCNAFASQPPLPASPPPPLPMEPPRHERLVSSSPPGTSASFFPVSAGSSAPLSSAYPPPPEYNQSISSYQHNLHVSSASANEELHMLHYTSSSMSSRGSEQPLRDLPSEKSKVIDAFHILRHPYRATRPDHLVIILRGLPGSGKSYLAKMLRELEIENGGTAPRIHSMDDYFMTEVDKVEESEITKSSGSVRGKKITKKVMEYCYEPEMEEAYRSSMLKSFKKTLDDGAFSFVIVDDRNLRVADFAQFWATAKRSGYEVYLLEATYKDPAGCAARNVHGFTRDDVQRMAAQWEEAPSMYLKLDVKSLLHGDALEEGGIQEVDMDMEDDDSLGMPSALDEENIEKFSIPPQEDIPADGDVKDDQESDHEVDQIADVKGLAKSKWSSDLDEDDTRRNEDATKNLNALSGLIQSYSKEGKSVRWGDQVTKRGFSIGATKATNVSLLIGPGAGYNLKSNPLPEEEKLISTRNNGEPKRQNIFQERLRAERESFRAVFESFRTGSDKRRHRISGLDAEGE